MKKTYHAPGNEATLARPSSTNADSNAARAALPTNQHVPFAGANHQLHRDRTELMWDAFRRFTASL